MNEMMNSMMKVEFTPPGPGSWSLDASHQERPFSGYMSALVSEPFERAFRDASARYGIQLETVRMRVVHGFLYTQPHPVGAPEGATGVPPKFVFKVLQRLHPELRRRNRDARRAFDQRLWREDMRKWDEEIRPQLEADYRRLLDEDLGTLSDEAFVDHLATARRAVVESWYIHHLQYPTCAVPMGDLIARVKAWTGQDEASIVRAVRGSSPASCGDEDTLMAIVDALREQVDALALVNSPAPEAEIVAALMARQDAVGEATRAWRDLIGYRPVTGFDLIDLSALEMPEMLVASLRRLLAGKTTAANRDRAAAALDAMRQSVPEAHRAEFDAMLEEVHLTHRLRDERVAYCDAWMVGMLRRAMLEAGTRLRAAGKLLAADHVFDLLPDEVESLLKGASSPSSTEAASRTARRNAITLDQAPDVLGPPPRSPPPADWVPGAGARMADAVGAYVAGMFQDSDASSSSATVAGYAASCGVATGRARVVLSAEDFAKVEKGDILVARCTSPTYNVLLPLLAGVVTDRGGLLCHAAIVAREYGIPGVVGSRDATRLIPDGAMVRIDGEKGTVELLS